MRRFCTKLRKDFGYGPVGPLFTAKGLVQVEAGSSQYGLN